MIKTRKLIDKEWYFHKYENYIKDQKNNNSNPREEKANENTASQMTKLRRIFVGEDCQFASQCVTMGCY